MSITRFIGFNTQARENGQITIPDNGVELPRSQRRQRFLVGSVHNAILDGVSIRLAAPPRYFDQGRAEVNGRHPPAQRCQPPGHNPIAAGHIQDALARPQGQQPFHSRGYQAAVELVAFIPMQLVPKGGFLLPQGASFFIQ